MDYSSNDVRPDPMRTAWATLANLLAGQPFAVLATQGHDAPYASLVCFAATADLNCIVFPTRAGTRKFANLEACPQVALLIDNRSNQPGDLREAVAVTVTGTVQLDRGDQMPVLHALLRAKHPGLAGFLAESDCRLATVRVEEYSFVSRFEQVTRLNPSNRHKTP